MIYNNIFNNTNNFEFSGSNIDTWNITKKSGTNIIGGFHFGGNFWVNPKGTGFSQTCIDSEGDGICDSSYSLDIYNIDYLPLSMNFTLDITPPKTISNLNNISYAQTYINWTWTDSADEDFEKVMIYLNESFQINITKGIQYYNATGLTPNTIYNLNTRTVDVAGNTNITWVNHTAMTAPSVTITPPPDPNIISWENNQSNNDSLSLNVKKGTTIYFNVTSNQSVDWISLNSLYVSGNETTEGNFLKTFTELGNNYTNITCNNVNGSCLNWINWTIEVVPVSTPTPTPTSYDTNGNGKIDKNEAVQAVRDYFSGTITKQEAISVVRAYFSG